MPVPTWTFISSGPAVPLALVVVTARLSVLGFDDVQVMEFRTRVFESKALCICRHAGMRPPFLYGSHYSCPGYVMFWMVRAAPGTCCACRRPLRRAGPPVRQPGRGLGQRHRLQRRRQGAHPRVLPLRPQVAHCSSEMTSQMRPLPHPASCSAQWELFCGLWSSCMRTWRWLALCLKSWLAAM